MAQFFIAYSRRDFYFAESLFYALHSQGVDAWMDVWKITPGNDWDDAISTAIQSSQGLILVASKDSLQSPNVRNEICRAYQAHMPIYLVLRSAISKRDLHITHEYPSGTRNSVPLLRYATAIVDMRADFSRGVEKLAACLFQRAQSRDRIPGVFSLRRERILYIPPVLVALVLTMILTEILAFGIEILYPNGFGQLMAYIRDAVQGRVGEFILLIPNLFGAIIAYGAVVNVLVFGFNFARRKRVSANQFSLLLASTFVILGTVLFLDASATILQVYAGVVNSVGVFLKQGESAPRIDFAPIALFIFHGFLALLAVILGSVFVRMSLTYEGRGAILRWLPTGYASDAIRREGNERWIRRLPDVPLSPPPLYTSYYVVASPADALIAAEIRSMLQQRGYTVPDNQLEAECDLIVLSPFADDSPLKDSHGVGRARPAIYVLARSVKFDKDVSIAIQWIDYRRPSEEQFWKQWEKRFSNLTRGRPVFPYVPESLVDSLLPSRYGCSITFLMITLAAGAALLVGEYEYATLVKNALHSLLLPASIVCLLLAGFVGYRTVAQILRAVITPSRVTSWLAVSGVLILVAVFMTQSRLLIISGVGVALVTMFAATVTQSSQRRWLPAISSRSHRKGLLRPISYYRVMVSYAFSSVMIFGFLLANSTTTAVWISPNVPQQLATNSYTVTVPGPYYLAAPGLWGQDTYARVNGYHFDYLPNKLVVSQSQTTGYPTWVKFYGVSSSPMRFAPHFTSSVHIHFSNSDLRTDVGLVLNDFVGDPRGPQLRLSASGLWMIVESNGKHYSDQLSPEEQSHDYTVEVEVNGILCIFKINGVEVTELTDASAVSVKDIMLSLSNIAPGGTTWSLSDFTYTPLPGPALSQSEAIQRVTALRMTPYTTVAPGWSCNPNDGRWDASFEPAQPGGVLTCTTKGTLLNTSPQAGVLLYFTNDRYGEFPSAFDYSFNATFEGSTGQCVSDATYANATVGKLYLYVFDICSDGTWAVKYVGFYSDNHAVFLNRELRRGHITTQKTATLLAQFRGTKVSVYVDGQFVTSYEDQGLVPSILFTSDNGPVLFGNFTFVPKAQY